MFELGFLGFMGLCIGLIFKDFKRFKPHKFLIINPIHNPINPNSDPKIILFFAQMQSIQLPKPSDSQHTPYRASTQSRAESVTPIPF
jgi:hypothetical protein